MNNSGHKWIAIRIDVFRAAALAVLVVLLWCTFYNRWTPENWQIPLTYPVLSIASHFEKGDVMWLYAEVKAAKEGHFAPFQFKTVQELGAPYDGNWNDYPITEYFQRYVPGLLARVIGVFAAVNFAIMMEFVLAAVAFYTACRLSRCSWIWSFAGAVVFAFSRYVFAHGAQHITCTYCWHIPLCILVGRWIFMEEGIQFGEWRFVFALCVAYVTGVQSPYYTNMFAQFVLFGGLTQWWLQRNWRAGLPAAAIIATAAASFLLMNMGTFVYHFVHGPNSGAVDRSYHWLEIYSLKLVDMVMPPPDHRIGLLAEWARSHIVFPTTTSFGEIVLSPGELPPTAYLGMISLAVLVWLTVVSVRAAVQKEKLPIEAWMILWIYLYAGTGSINGIIGTLGFVLFRATTRYSIWILCILLMYGVRRLTAFDHRKWIEEMSGPTPWAAYFPYGVAIAVMGIALFDQTSPVVTDEELRDTATLVDSDRNFAEAMEQHLPPDTMIFQLPIMQFPESPYPNVSSYDNFRPYLFSRHLRYSFGSEKGRPKVAWQMEVAKSSSLNEIVSKLESYGFGALYINRNAFPDRGENILKGLKGMGFNDIIESERGDLVCVILKPSLHPVLPDGGLFD